MKRGVRGGRSAPPPEPLSEPTYDSNITTVGQHSISVVLPPG